MKLTLQCLTYGAQDGELIAIDETGQEHLFEIEKGHFFRSVNAGTQMSSIMNSTLSRKTIQRAVEVVANAMAIDLREIHDRVAREKARSVEGELL